MRKSVISIEHVTKDYRQGRGNFDISLQVKEGETVGIVGENGSGKTTLLRQVMGFIKSDQGRIRIYNFDAYRDAADTKIYIGYVPGEINFPEAKTGAIFLHDYGRSLGMKEEDFTYADELIKRMQLDVRAYPKRMSKGMKQKTSIVAALMRKAPILVMDEPSLGLDPLMREELLSLILEQKKKGATILMTGNTIEELERVCDRVAYLSQGRILDIADVSLIHSRFQRDFKIEFKNDQDYISFLKGRKDILRVKPEIDQVTLRIDKDRLPDLFDTLSGYDIKYISEVKYDLTTYFSERRKALSKEKSHVN